MWRIEYCVFVVSLIVLSAAAARDLDFFEAAFGKTFLYHESLGAQRHELFAVAHQKHTKRMLKHDRPGQFLGCSDYSSSGTAVQTLRQEYGEESVHTILSSKTDQLGVTGVGDGVGLACFLVQPSTVTSSLFDAKSYLEVWLPVPPSMKLSASAHAQLEALLELERAASAVGPSSSQTRAIMNQLESTELEVHLGKASMAGTSTHTSGSTTLDSRRARTSALATSLQASLLAQSRSTEVRSSGLAELSAMMPHAKAWQTVSAAASAVSATALKKGGGHVRRQLAEETAEMSTGDAGCNFDKLIFRAHDEFLFITHMHELANPSCFASVLSTVAQNPDVVSVSAPEGLYQPLMDLVGDLLHSGDPTEGRVYHDVGLTGAGVVVGLLDGGVDEYSCFFRNSDDVLCPRSKIDAPTHDTTRRKIIQYVYDDDDIEKNVGGHGTGMASIICGEDTNGTYPEHFGVAPGAKIAFYDASTSSGANIGPLGDNLDTYFDAAITTGAKFYSASFGNRYTEYVARDVVNDQYAVDNDFLLIAAVGNYQSSQYNTTIFSPARSKNALSVGSSGTSGDSNINSLSYFSVMGPTADGRFGVDVLAHGVDVYAAKSYGNTGTTATSCELISRTGTSSSTAAVAGVAALVQEYFQNASFWASSCNQFYPLCAAGAASPKSILVKAVILHSGQDIGNSLSYPGNEQGFGRVQLNSVLMHPGVTATGLDLFVEEVELVANDNLLWTITVTSSALPLKVTIAWVDPANVVSASKQLLNDVDLRITDESGTVTYGNNNAAGDAHNNAEMAYIAAPAPGEYVVSVSIGTLGSGTSQAVSIVATSYGSVTLTPYTIPTGEPSAAPTGEPTFYPSGQPSAQPSGSPTHQPNYNRPSKRPFFAYMVPTPAPVPVPTPAPVITAEPTPAAPSTENRAPTAKPFAQINIPTYAP